MSLVVPAIGYVIIAMALAILIAPGTLKTILGHLATSDRLYIVV